MSYVMSLKSYSTFQISLYPARIDIKWVYINMPVAMFVAEPINYRFMCMWCQLNIIPACISKKIHVGFACFNVRILHGLGYGLDV